MHFNWTLPALPLSALDVGRLVTDVGRNFHSVFEDTRDPESGTSSSDVDMLHVCSSVLGGIALLSYSMSLMSRGLRTAFGSSLRSAIKAACSHKAFAFLAGAAATALLTSATATSLLVLQFVQSADMTFVQSLGVSLGINVGSTLNAHLMAFQVHKYGLLLVGIGYACQVLPLPPLAHSLGESVMGLGLLFLSITCLGDGIAPLQHYKPFLGALAHMSKPLVAILASGVCAVLFQSSNTVIAIAILLGSQGFITLDIALYFVLGSNVGTCFTTVLAAIGKKREAMQVAISYLLFKTVGVLILLVFFPQFSSIIEASTSSAKLKAEEHAFTSLLATQAKMQLTPADLERIQEMTRRTVMPAQIANAHTLVNVFIALIFMPFLEMVAALVTVVWPVHVTHKRDLDFSLPTTAADLAPASNGLHTPHATELEDHGSVKRGSASDEYRHAVDEDARLWNGPDDTHPLLAEQGQASRSAARRR